MYVVLCVLTECKTMSKLALGRAKLASSVSSAFGPPPPDKKRKTDDDVTAETGWDDDLDIILTQNMNKLDSIVASTQAVKSEYNECANNNENDMSHHIPASMVGLVCKQEGEEMCSSSVLSTGKRLIGHGSSHSLSADCLNNSASGTSAQITRKSSFSMEKLCTSKESDELQFLTSCQVDRAACSSTNRTNIVDLSLIHI